MVATTLGSTRRWTTVGDEGVKVALFGKTGQVGTEIQRCKPDDVSLEIIGRDRADFSSPTMVTRVAEQSDADVFINAVAFTAVDKAEEQAEMAMSVNRDSVAALAKVAAARGIPLIHISTDYVFDGTGDHARAPSDSTGPLGVYGATKLAGEDSIRQEKGTFAILRTSWVFSAHGGNFVKTMLRLAADRDQLSIVADQVGGPTSAASIAQTVFKVARALRNGHVGGTYHFSGSPDVSWAGFAREIFSQTGLDVSVSDILTKDYPTPATRPLNSRLDCESLAKDFAITRPDWREDLKIVLKELGAL